MFPVLAWLSAVRVVFGAQTIPPKTSRPTRVYEPRPVQVFVLMRSVYLQSLSAAVSWQVSTQPER